MTQQLIETIEAFDNVLKNFGISPEFIHSYKNCIKSDNFTIDSQKLNNNEAALQAIREKL